MSKLAQTPLPVHIEQIKNFERVFSNLVPTATLVINTRSTAAPIKDLREALAGPLGSQRKITADFFRLERSELQALPIDIEIV